MIAGTRTMMGVKPAQMAKAIAPLGVVALGVNCGRSLEENLSCIAGIKTKYRSAHLVQTKRGYARTRRKQQSHLFR